MPLVRIDVVEHRRNAEELRELANVVQGVMVDVFGAPENDRYQIISQHFAGEIILDDSGLGFTRSEDIVVIEVTHQGRDDSQKQAMYRLLSERLGDRLGLSGDDLVVSVSRNERSDWSFGRGESQFMDGELR